MASPSIKREKRPNHTVIHHGDTTSTIKHIGSHRSIATRIENHDLQILRCPSNQKNQQTSLKIQILKKRLHRLFESEYKYLVYIKWYMREALDPYTIFCSHIQHTLTALEDMGATEDDLTMYSHHFKETINTLEWKPKEVY